MPPDETFVVDPASKGVANVFIYVRSKVGKFIEFSRDGGRRRQGGRRGVRQGQRRRKYAEVNERGNKVTVKLTGPAVMDQVACRYIPHALAMRQGQKLLVKNPESVNHNVNVISFVDDNKGNNNMPPKTVQVLKLTADAQPVGQECNVHPWMKAYILVVDHPYFAVTGKDGSFMIKNLPPGELEFAIRNSNGIYVERRLKVTVEAGKVTTLPDFKFAPKA